MRGGLLFIQFGFAGDGVSALLLAALESDAAASEGPAGARVAVGESAAARLYLLNPISALVCAVGSAQPWAVAQGYAVRFFCSTRVPSSLGKRALSQGARLEMTRERERERETSVSRGRLELSVGLCASRVPQPRLAFLKLPLVFFRVGETSVRVRTISSVLWKATGRVLECV